MKNIKLLLVSMLAAVFSGCMDHHDDPTNYTYGNPAVGEANTTIADLKTKYAGIVSSNKAEEVQENLVISGVVVGDDESGNIYKNLYVNDGSGTLVVGINATGLYAFLPVGQPDLSYPELTPMEIDEAWLSSANKADAAFFVKINDAEFVEADGLTQYAPEAEGDGGNGVNRTLKVGNTNIPFRTSTYANFSTEYMKMGKVDVTGLLTQYNGEWQLTVRTSRDIQ